MLSQIYPISFLLALGALTSWFYFQENEMKNTVFKNVFYFSFLAFMTSWVLNEGQWEYKFMKLGREILLLVAVPMFLNLFKAKKWVFLALLFSILGVMDFFYFDELKTTFPQAMESRSEPLNLDHDGELLIEILDNHQLSEIQTLLNQYDLTATPAFFPKDKSATDLDDYYLINIPDSQMSSFVEVKKALSENGLIEWVEENEQYALSPLESESKQSSSSLNEKYGLNDPGLDKLWGFDVMQVNDLYAILSKKKPTKKALIAILDTGIDAGHEDIKDNYTSVQQKYDNDTRGHGTHCAGIAAAVSNNQIGVASFSQTNDYVEVTSVKVLSGGGFGTQKTIINGILEAADAGADVLSLSLGGLSNDSRQRAYKKAVAYANKKGAIVVVAAGNSNRSAEDFSPANTPGVITVSAIDTLVNRANFSNKIDGLKMGVAAPGVKIYSTFPKNEYRTFNGTSMATPYVAGLVGLMKSFNPSITTKQVYEILKQTGAQTNNPKETGQLIQPGAAIKKLLQAT